MKTKQIIISLLLLPFMPLSLISCDIKVGRHELIKGLWQIDYLLYLDSNMMNNYVEDVVIFESKGICNLPIKNSHERNTDKEMVQWDTYIKNKKNYIKIEADSTIFGGLYEVDFRRDSLGDLYMLMVSEKTKILCKKQRDFKIPQFPPRRPY